MAKSSGKRTTSSTAPKRADQESRIFTKYLILPIIASAVVSLIVTNLNKPPSVPASTAHTFLDDYFSEVTHARSAEPSTRTI